MDVDLQNIKKWVILYPIYINSKKTLAEGWRINLLLRQKTFAESACLRQAMKRTLDTFTEIWNFELMPPRKQLMLHVAELVPRHPGRTKKQEPTTSAAAGSKSGKAGKKKR
ncbi:signal recognition particle 19 kDa protein-like [Salvia splendens]|uniref:signal recognition particle 19 kDa protein-like n=1 Tax=Salvia splendens TaxID=180675 RepID=UPI001C26E7AB|nr:signal recognition particle 19 kDa protein-like [Salvia splendens]